MDKATRNKVREWIVLSLGSLGVLLLMFGLMFAIILLDDSDNKCASKIAAKVYDTRCF